MSKRIIVTGASGLLGRAIATFLQNEENTNPKFEIQRWVFSRVRDEKIDKKVNIANKDEVDKAVDEFKPDAIIHSAAIRAPDLVEKQQDFAQSINVLGSKYLAEAAARHNIKLIYISTDYVFDGTNPPYNESAQPNPLNNYGRQKLAGEQVVLEHCPGAVVLRVPILYGPVEFLDEGAVDGIMKIILNKQKPVEISHYERRYPTHVEDVAAVINVLLRRHFEEAQEIDAKQTSIQGIYHWSGDEEMTKYDMAKVMSEVFSLPIDHLTPNSSAPAPNTTTTRPYNAHLSCQRLQELGARNRHYFKEGIERALTSFVPKA